MRLTAEMMVRDGSRYRVVDLDTGMKVPLVTWIDTEPVPSLGPGVWVLEAVRTGPQGDPIKDADGNKIKYVAKGRFKIERVDSSPPKQITMGAPKCARCQSTMTLPGDDLCPQCRAADRLQVNRFVAERIEDPFGGHKCEQCSADAVWSVSDEVTVTPVQRGFTVVSKVVRGRTYRVVRANCDGKQQWQRASLVGRRYFCKKHYKPPRLLDASGEPIRDIEESRAQS